MSEIFKLYYNNNNTIANIYIFVGDYLYQSKKKIDDIKDLFINNPQDTIFNEIFNKLELENIIKNKTPVEFIDDIIYQDDSIEIIKFKLLKYLKSYAYEEIYFYSYIKDPINNNLFQQLTQNGALELTKFRLLQFLINIDNPTLIEKLPNKEIYNYDDFMSLDLKNILIKKSIGQKFVGLNYDLVYTVNPFDVVKYDTILEKSAENIISTNNKNLLFEYKIKDNIIYFCFLKDVMIYADNKNLNQESTIKIYFPYLFNNEITTIDQFNLSQKKLLTKTKKIIDSNNFIHNNDSIKLFNNLYNNKLEYIEQGIRVIELNIHPHNKFNFPLDIIFKLIHATKDIPFIKFNPGMRQENIYKLYSEKKSITGKKIPYLSKGIIFKLLKLIGNSKRVAMYIIKNDIPIIVEFNSNATIYVKLQLNESKDLIFIQQMIKEIVNPLIDILQTNIEQSGYTLNYFDNILSNNIEIININYYANIEILKNIDLNSIKSCISNIFNIIKYKLNEGIVMRYKRVSNYNEMNAIDSNIVELLKREFNEQEIINNLIDNYKLSQEDAKLKLATAINNLQLIQNLFQNKK